MTPEQYQLEKLQERATRTGVYYDLVSFLAAQRDMQGVEEIYRRLPISHERDRAICEVFLQETGLRSLTRLHALLQKVNDPWLLYSHTKFLLRTGRISEAMTLARENLAHNQRDTVCINLICRYLLAAGEKSLARLLADASLGANPVQKDVERLFDARTPPDLFLETFPRIFSIAFYLPVYAVERFLRFALEAVFGQNYPLKEVLVINDASPDYSREIAETFPVKIVDHPTNRGLAAARNTAFATASSELVATVDTDAYPTPDFLRNIVMEFENSDPQIVGVGGRFLELFREKPADLYRARYLHQDGGLHRECPAPMLFGCNTVFKRADVIRIGGYNEKYRTNGEDADISRRLTSAGLWLTYTPHAITYHRRTDTPESVLQTRWKYYFWYLEENGYYASTPQLAHLFLEYVRACSTRIQKDITENHVSLLYLHVLMVVHNTFLDLLQSEKEKTFSPEQVRGLQQAIRDVFTEVDKEYGGTLSQFVLRDTAHLLLPAPAQELPQTGLFAEGFRVFLAHLKSLLSRDIYPLICQSADLCELEYGRKTTENR